MTRREFLAVLATAGSALGAPARADAAAVAPGADDKLILSAPLTHSDWMLKPGVAWGEAGVRHMLDTCKACGWLRIYWRALDGGRALYRSKLLRPQGKWDADNFWDPQTEADKALAERFTAGMTPDRRAALRRKLESLDYAHFDSLAAAVSYGHSIGLQIHAWISINEDDHGWGLQSEFSRQHPQFRWRRRDGRAYRSQLSFAYAEVRDYKLAILRELLRHYAIDGLFLDWIRTGDVRDNPQTDPEGVADNGYEQPLLQAFRRRYDLKAQDVLNGDERWVRIRAEPQTLFMRAVRQLARSRKRPIPVCVLVGHPWHYRGEVNRIAGNLRGLLLDVKAWAREGLIDAAIPAGYYRDGGTPEAAWRALKEETESRSDIWAYTWVPQARAELDRDFALAGKVGARQLLFWEADYIDDRGNAAELKAAMSERAR